MRKRRHKRCPQTLKFRACSSANSFSTAPLPTMTALLPSKDFHCFAALKSLFWDSCANNSLGNLMKLDDLPWLIGYHITQLRISQVQWSACPS